MGVKRIPSMLGYSCVALCLASIVSCEHERTSENRVQAGKSALEDGTVTEEVTLRKMPAGNEFSGFLKDYSHLKPNSTLDGSALTFVQSDSEKNLHRYIAIIVDPVQVYIASDADAAKLPKRAPGVGANYFGKALVAAVSSAFPVVEQPGPLVLRLRSALVGVDVGGTKPSGAKSSDTNDRSQHTVDIGKVGVEMELLDSQTGDRIAAMVDRENLGAGAEISSAQISDQEKWIAARRALDGWAHRVRSFLNAAHELSPEDAKRADQAYRAYSDEVKER